MSGKSKEEIAFELVAKLKGVGIWGENNIESILDMYAKCLEATSGLRAVEGRKSSALQLTEAKSDSAIAKAVVSASAPAVARTPAPAPAVARTPAQTPAPVQRQPAPQQPAQPVVRQQQEQLQQAYQQQPVPQAR